jgi:polyisoprenyl-teichoic acid--peptidoglycan teichoic acid transferase
VTKVAAQKVALYNQPMNPRRANQLKSQKLVDGIEQLTTPPIEQRRLGWVVVKLVLALLMSLLFAVIVYFGYIAFSVAKISTQPLELSGLMTDEDGRVNILVLGVGDPGHDGEGLSDTMMILSLDTRSKRIAQISVPRDLRVNIPGHGSGKINEANSIGGVPLAEQVVANTLGIPIHYYVRTDFSGLKQMVDAVGGIDVNVKQRLGDPQYPCDDNQYKSCGLDIETGVQHMDGNLALKYARCRKGTCGDDFGRAARQQEVLNLVRAKIVNTDLIIKPKELMAVTQALRNGVQTDMGAMQMVLFGRSWQEAQANKPVSLVLSTAEGNYLLDDAASSDLLPVGGSFSEIQKRVQTIFDEPAP